MSKLYRCQYLNDEKRYKSLEKGLKATSIQYRTCFLYLIDLLLKVITLKARNR